MRTRSAASSPLWPAAALLCLHCGIASALVPGQPAPSFDLPWLSSEGNAGSGELFELADATVLMIWNRGCPRCTEIALGSPELADSAMALGAHAVGILFGPDDPEALREMLWDESILVPHLWDADARVAADYGLGFQHLGVFVIDRKGIIEAVFDDQIEDLTASVLPALRATLAAPVSSQDVPGAAAREPSRAVPPVQIEGRLKLLSAEKVQPGDTGLFGEALEPGTLLLYRWEARTALDLAPGVRLVPWLRLSNEPKAVLTEGAEQLSNALGSVTVLAGWRQLSASLGAFALSLSPLLLQRWDAEDAPPLGGVSSCGCGAGASGLSQRSLEILSPIYTFEGVSISASHRMGRARGWIAVPDWEQKVETSDPISEWDQARYRRILEGVSLDVGRTAMIDPINGLPSPLGLRLGILRQEDDRRSLPRDPAVLQPVERDERGLFALARIEPWKGCAAEAEYVDWTRWSRGEEVAAQGLRIGLRGAAAAGSVHVWGQVQHTRTDPGFDPFYMALSYDPNREGWRVAGGIGMASGGGGSRERLSLRFFHRAAREREEIDFPGLGRLRTRTSSATILVRPVRDWLAEIHGVATKSENPPRTQPDQTRNGLSVDLRWEASPQLDPMLRLDLIRHDEGSADPHTSWQAYLIIRALASL